MEQIHEDGGRAELPTAPEYLAQWLHDLGLCESGGMGPVPLSASEIAAWAAGTGHRLLGWEFEALQAASRAYVDEFTAERPEPPDGQTEGFVDPDVLNAKAARIFEKLATPVNRRQGKK
ncbi:MAG: hypothetical protein ACT6UH_00680 [Hydrogenophaga sp.]|uniref:hypothetical protein n=1 Tax=Hydrogenophaga sp. TaxID=1904254 RepID=UPI00403630A6